MKHGALRQKGPALLCAFRLISGLALLAAAQGSAAGYVRIDSYKWVFSPLQQPTVGLRAYEEKSIALELYRVDLSGSGTAEWASNLPEREGEVAGERVRSWAIAVPPEKRKDQFKREIPVPTKGIGVYILIARGRGGESREVIIVTELSLVAKKCGDRLLAWVTDIASGEPVAGQTVRASQRRGEDAGPSPAQTLERVTDSDGLAEFAVSSDEAQFVSVRSGDSVAYCTTYRGERDREEIYLYTERPVYRPGQTVHFKGIARKDLGHRWEVLANETVQVSISDPDYNDIFSAKYTTNEFGSFAGTFEVSPAALLGEYHLRAGIEAAGRRWSGASFYVEEYRKPEFGVSIAAPEKIYLAGEKIPFEVDASYYFGAPVPGAEVEYGVYSGYCTPSWETATAEFEGEFEEYESDEVEYYSFGQALHMGETRTGPDGTATIAVTAQPRRALMRYILEASVTDTSRRMVSDCGSCVVAQGRIVPSVEVDGWIKKPGEEIIVSLKATDVVTEAGVPHQVNVSLLRTWWVENNEEEDWNKRWTLHSEEISTHEVVTGADGKAVLELAAPDQDGRYRVKAAAVDEEGRAASDTAWFTVAPQGWGTYYSERSDLRIECDQARYVPGDTARVLITASEPDSHVLVSIEGSRLFEYRVEKLNGHSAAFDVPIREEYEPNVFFEACSVSDAGFASSSASIRVTPSDAYLDVSVSTDKESYGPGEVATYGITTTDLGGRPVSADVSLGVVDDAIYAVERDLTPDIRKFFYGNKLNTVGTSYSFERSVAYTMASEYEETEPFADIDVRKRFEDTAYWNPCIVTDGSGKATVSFELPDNLTTWRATAIAATPETAVGQARHRQMVTKPLVARLATPRFLTQGDVAVVSGIVHNYTAKMEEVSVSLEVEGADLVEGDARQTITIDPGGHHRFEWAVRPELPTTATFTLKALGADANDAMALSVPVNPLGVRQVESYSGAVASETSRIFLLPRDSLTGTASLKVTLSPSLGAIVLGSLRDLAEYPYGCIEQTMSAFLPDVLLACAMRDLGLKSEWLDANLDEMVEVGLQKIYNKQGRTGGWGWSAHDEVDPYWTNYVVYGLLMAREAGYEVNQEKLDRALAALRQAAAEPGDKRPRPEVLYTLSIADGDRWRVNAIRALAGLRADLRRGADRSANELESSLSFLALAFARLGDEERAKECCRLLRERADTTSQTANWGSGEGALWYSGTQDVETTALALRALLVAEPESPLIPRAVNWLLQERRGRKWHSTKDSSAVLMAMVEYLRTSRELGAHHLARVRVNGREVAEVPFAEADLFRPEREIEVAPDLLRTGPNVVSVSKDGEGTLYWTAVLDYCTPAEKVRSRAPGLAVEKLYLKAEGAPKDGWDWEWRYSSAKGGVKPGDLICCKLVIRSDKLQHYVLIKDPIPAGCEFQGDEPERRLWRWDRWYGQHEYHDDHMAFLTSSLNKGKNVITYYLRAETPGEFHVSPAEISAMYAPEIRANSQAMTLRIRE